ncbi:MAG: hypothetical protein OXG79_13560 [Chloroflexi bacterium]|nr:hypothetical protein [Chloroflexota bacterium]
MGRWRKLAVAVAGAAIVSVVAVSLVLAHGGGFGGKRVSPVEILSDLTGVSVEDIRSARESGDSLADIAEANDVTTDDYVAAVVDAATTAIDDAVADGKLSEDRAAEIKEGLTDKVTAMVTSDAGWHGRSRGWAVKLDNKPSPVVVLSELSGVSVEEIREQRVEGTSLADIAEANGLTKDEYVDELVTRATAAIDAAVEAGRLSEERAQTMKDGLADRVESIVTNTDEPGRGHGWGRGFGHGGRGGKHGGCHSSKSTPADASASRLAL